MKTIIIIVITMLIVPCTTKAQDEYNSIYASEILKNYNRLEGKFKEFYMKKLIDFLEDDPILKKNFLTGDSLNFKNLNLHIDPILKFKKEAQNYVKGQNIFSLIEFDTIDYHCVAKFYLNDTLLFVISRGHNECDIGPVTPGAESLPWCPGKYYFFQYYYDSKVKMDCQGVYYSIITDKHLIVFIDLAWVAFIISENNISIADDMLPLFPNNHSNKIIQLLAFPHKFLEYVGTSEERIRYCSKNCPAGGKKPWWKFWE